MRRPPHGRLTALPAGWLSGYGESGKDPRADWRLQEVAVIQRLIRPRLEGIAQPAADERTP